MQKILIIAAASTLLAGCAGWVDEQGQPLTFGKAMGAIAEGAAEARAAQQPQTYQNPYILNQVPSYAPPQVQPVTPPGGDTTTLMCRSVTGAIVACRRIN